MVAGTSVKYDQFVFNSMMMEKLKWRRKNEVKRRGRRKRRKRRRRRGFTNPKPYFLPFTATSATSSTSRTSTSTVGLPTPTLPAGNAYGLWPDFPFFWLILWLDTSCSTWVSESLHNYSKNPDASVQAPRWEEAFLVTHLLS